ncbi:MAG: cohesin domain-containing protein [Archaeoglobaceae archaeon]|nr:cohesin domain-containing protein [Archaeoglobaceae archaeon]
MKRSSIPIILFFVFSICLTASVKIQITHNKEISSLSYQDNKWQYYESSERESISAIKAKIFIEPNKTTVAPGERFAVDISLQDGTAQSVLVNFTFDPTKITYVSNSTQRLFRYEFIDVNESLKYVKYMGFGNPVSIATKTKVATAVFQVNSNASGTISFSIVTANIDGTNASAIVQSLTIVREPWQAYDRDGDGKIGDMELVNAIMDWLNNRLSDLDLINVIMKWLSI